MTNITGSIRMAGMAALLLAAAPFGEAPGPAADWKPAASPLLTPWAKDVVPDKVWPEYPRPQLVRPDWVNLNGLWDYAIVPIAQVSDASGHKPSVTYEGKILVPFPVESALSGVRRQLLPVQLLYYRRTFKAPDLKDGKRLLLHFGAVDWETKVFINGKLVGTHRGGYDAFTFDITDAVKAGADNEIVVVVFDPTGGTRGKQNLNSMFNPGGIMYTPCSGIWQTVWLEPVPACRIEELQISPDVDAGALRLKVVVKGAAPGTNVEAAALDGVREVARARGEPGASLTLPIAKAHLWTPDDPFLYGLKVKVAGDEVASYFGMRKIALGKDERGITRMLLNGKFVFQAGVLDQGFWPDGIYTAPSDEALRFDVEMMKKLGLNMARKHVKVEPQRWYYWCDKLGLLVWQDMPSGDISRGNDKKKDGVALTEEIGRQFKTELKALIDQHRNHPSIMMWVVFNEGWGQHDTVAMTKWVKDLDPSRLVSNASGWHDRHCGDIIDMHNYPGPGSPNPEPTRAAVLGEFGGLGLPVPEHVWTEKSWGYKGMPSRKALTRHYVDLWRKVYQLKDNPGLSAVVYTQWTDVEAECNGLLTYDRKVVKVDAEQATAAHRGKFAPPPEYVTVVPTAQAQPIPWRYTTTKPADDWFKPGFQDSAWQEGPAGFGSGKPAQAAVRTPWNTSDLWLRRQIILPDTKLHGPTLMVSHRGDVEIYLNGVLAARTTGRSTGYEEVDLTPEAEAALRQGPNLIAVHCRQIKGGQHIDVGLVQLK